MNQDFRALTYLVCAILLCVSSAGCERHAPAESQLSAPNVPPTGAAADAYKQINTNDLIRTARVILTSMERVPAEGKFSGFHDVAAIAKRTNAPNNYQWQDFQSIPANKLNGPSAYRSLVGNFIVFEGTAANGKKIGLVVNLANQKTSLYAVDSAAISPSGDPLSSAFVIAKEALSKSKMTIDGAGAIADEGAVHEGALQILDKTMAQALQLSAEPIPTEEKNLGMTLTASLPTWSCRDPLR